MAQDYESVGQASPSLTAVAAEHQGWDTDTPMSLGDAQTDPHYSFRGDRANTQILHQIVPTMAGHEETPMAERSPAHW